MCTGQEVFDVVDGGVLLSKLFSKEQRAFYSAYAPPEIALDNLTALGPTFLLRAKHQPKTFDRRVSIELWLYPDGSRIFELSTKAEPKEGFQVAADFKAYLAECGSRFRHLRKQRPRWRSISSAETCRRDRKKS